MIVVQALLIAGVPASEIRTYPLDEHSVYTIRLGKDEPTTCVFPARVTALEGAGISSRPEDHPPVLLSYQSGQEFFSLRPLQDHTTAALNVIYGGRIYVLRLTTGAEPDRAVVFLEQPLAGQGGRPLGILALRALFDRAKYDGRIEAQYPELSSNIARARPGNTTLYPHFTVTVEEVFRFDAEDTIVLRTRFANPSEAAVHYDRNHLAVRVGDDVFPAALTDASGAIAPQSATHVCLAITGTPDGNRANLSVHETFSVIVPPTP
jgi:hypothetical protein